MSQRIFRILPRLFAAVILVNLALLMGCGGTAGVDNGRIVGKVFSNLRDRSAQRLAEPGVTVVTQREGGTPPIIRTTTTAADGTYSFGDLPTGAYVIGFAKEGFRTIDTSAGATSTRTAVGSQVRVFIDSGRTSVAPDVTMIALQPSGDATILVSVKDRVTGGPITDAVVTAGPITQTKNVNGVYTMVVPIVRRNNDDPFGAQEISVNIAARAEGFNDYPIVAQNDPSVVRALPGETTRFNAVMTPLGSGDTGAVTLQGTYRFSRFQNLLGLTNDIRIGIRGVSDLQGVAATLTPANGTWLITGVPPSSATIQRTFTIVFEHPDIVTKELVSIPIPRGGTVTITEPVILEPLLVDVIGKVTISADSGATIDPNVGLTEGGARIEETGQSGNVETSGFFTISGVPARNLSTDNTWKLRVVATRATTGNLFKAADLDIRPLNTSGTNNPIPVFDVGFLQANTVAQ